MTTNNTTVYSGSTVAYSGFGLFLIGLLILVLMYLKVKARYIAWITDKPYEGRWSNLDSKVRLMDYLQLGTIAVSMMVYYVVLPNIAAPVISGFDIGINEFAFSRSKDALFNADFYVIFAGVVVNIILFLVYMIICKNNRTFVVLLGLRNILTLICGFLATLHVDEIGIISSNGYGASTEHISKEWIYGFDITWVFIVFVVFEIIYIVIDRNKKRRLNNVS